ncbi:MAG: phosphatidylglycerol lysyltransferase domain-containing protein [Proteobacteria bacterium]|nr:phosphatidylglycerol lysyltransferase domain-containing protein [Pseudomonadota bacterium]
MPTSRKSLSGEPLGLHHQATIQERLIPLGHGLSEYCFSNLFLFRHVHQYRLIDSQFPFISGLTYDGSLTLLPVFGLKNVNPGYLKESLTGYDCYYPISKEDLNFFDPDYYTFSINRDDSDYVYSTTRFLDYSGRKLAPKKNLLTQFLTLYDPSIRPLNFDTIQDAVSVLDQWLGDVGKEKADTDYDPCREALSNLDKLCLSGIVYYNNQKPLGFLITKEVVPGMCVIHFAKGLRSIKGIFQYMFHNFAHKHSERYHWINFEQDLGKPNFRKTKKSYHPDKLLKKYRVSIRTKYTGSTG